MSTTEGLRAESSWSHAQSTKLQECGTGRKLAHTSPPCMRVCPARTSLICTRGITAARNRQKHVLGDERIVCQSPQKEHFPIACGVDAYEDILAALAGLMTTHGMTATERKTWQHAGS